MDQLRQSLLDTPVIETEGYVRRPSDGDGVPVLRSGPLREIVT